jgi:hypothetical protein
MRPTAASPGPTSLSQCPAGRSVGLIHCFLHQPSPSCVTTGRRPARSSVLRVRFARRWPGRTPQLCWAAVHSGRTVTESVTETSLSPCTQDTPDNDEVSTTSHGRATRERSALWQCGARVSSRADDVARWTESMISNHIRPVRDCGMRHDLDTGHELERGPATDLRARG